MCGSIPFDDSDIKKMIKIQMEGRVKFPHKMVDKIDVLARDLVYKMLEPDVTKRANIDKVLKHDWLQTFEN